MNGLVWRYHSLFVIRTFYGFLLMDEAILEECHKIIIGQKPKPAITKQKIFKEPFSKWKEAP